MDQIFELHGLRVRGELSLGGVAVAGDAADVDVTWRAASAPGVEPPPGELLALGPGQPPYSVVVGDAGVVVRVPGICDVMITDGVMEVASPPEQRELASIVAAGTGLAVLLARRGRCVLHASAVRTSGGAVAIAAPSGGGKSTLAALCLAAGAELVSDDVLVVDAPPRCWPGARRLRLRPLAAAALTPRFPPEWLSRTADGRIAVTPPPIAPDPVPLTAVVLPVRVEAGEPLAAERLRGSAAAAALLANPRVFGWRDAAVGRLHLDVLARIAATVPVHRVRVPWRLPPDPDLGAPLLALVEQPPIPSGEADAHLEGGERERE